MKTNATKRVSRYHRALTWLYGLESRGIKLGLQRMQEAVARRGHPEKSLRIVHVAGSNGKGSVCAMLERSLRAAGYHTGWFSSPHLHRYTERVRIAGRALSEREVATRIHAFQKATNLPPLTFFEVTTLLALEAFRDHACDIVVMEVGLGGRLDSTNVVTPEVSVVTNIALDHTRILGTTMQAIAAEKAGIFKKSVPAVTGARDPEALAELKQHARRQKSTLSVLDHDFGVYNRSQARKNAREYADFWMGTGSHAQKRDMLRRVHVGLRGAHQWDNAAVALAALHTLTARGWEISEDNMRHGLAHARWPGRLEHVSLRGRPSQSTTKSPSQSSPSFLFDAAHNPDGCERLAAYVKSLPKRGKRVLLFGAMADKDHKSMLAALDDCGIDARVYAIPNMRRAVETKVLADVRQGVCARSVKDGLVRAQKEAGEDGCVIVAGSIFLVQEVRAFLLNVRSDPPIAM